jgi:hypothetical protein
MTSPRIQSTLEIRWDGIVEAAEVPVIVPSFPAS